MMASLKNIAAMSVLLIAMWGVFALAESHTEEIDLDQLGYPVILTTQNHKTIESFHPWVVIFDAAENVDDATAEKATTHEGLVRFAVANPEDSELLKAMVSPPAAPGRPSQWNCKVSQVASM
jgi:hypothetical protein